MKQFHELKKEREILFRQRKDLLKEKQIVEDKISKNYELTCGINRKISECYFEYFDSKQNKEFVLYEDYPTGEVLEQFILRNTNGFPLYEYGIWNVLELAVFIKHCFSFERQREFTVMPIGLTRKYFLNKMPKLDANLFLLIGNEETLKPYEEWKAKYVNNASSQKFLEIAEKKEKDFVSIALTKSSVEPFVPIKCSPENYIEREKNLDGIHYYNYLDMEFKHANFSLNKQIYERSMRGVKGISDVFTFPLAEENRFLANILVSVAIYKRNNGIAELSGNDYFQIMKTLYDENVSIIKDAEEGIERVLTHINSNIV